MDCQMKKKKKKKKKLRSITSCTTTNEKGGEDRISGLPDELIHQILSFSDAKLAVQTSALSRRWKFIWTTLPFLNFQRYDYELYGFTPLLLFKCSGAQNKFFNNFLYHRNHECELSVLNLGFQFSPPPGLVWEYITYAIAHKVQEIVIDFLKFGFDDIKLSSFSSTSIKKLIVGVYDKNWFESENCWDLPGLTTLHMISDDDITLPESYLICLPSLQTLFLDGIQFPYSISLLALTALSLKRCILPSKAWYLPALITLTLEDVVYPQNMTEFFPALFNLQNLTLSFWTRITADLVIDCPRLVNLEINDCTSTYSSLSVKIIVLAPKIRNFSSIGFILVTFGCSFLENVNIKLMGSIRNAASYTLEKLYSRVTRMFSGLGSTKILTLHLRTLEALLVGSNYFLNVPSPFYNLKYVKVPKGYTESRIPDCLRSYLLGGSPKAAIVTTLPQDEVVSQSTPVCLTTHKIFPEKPLGALVATGSNHLASSSREAINSGSWRGHEVKTEFVGLLDCIVKKYPETFDYFTSKSQKTCSMNLNMLCTTVKAFTNTSMTEVNAELITKFRALFSDLERSFNVKWLVDRLNYIEQQFSQPQLD